GGEGEADGGRAHTQLPIIAKRIETAARREGDEQRPSRRLAASGEAARRPTTRASVLAVRLEEPRGALAAADAHRHHAVARLAPEQLVGDGANHARARHAERMADRDRAAVDVELRGIDAQAIAAVDHLRGEGLVELPHVDLAALAPRTPPALAHPLP